MNPAGPSRSLLWRQLHHTRSTWVRSGQGVDLSFNIEEAQNKTLRAWRVSALQPLFLTTHRSKTVHLCSMKEARGSTQAVTAPMVKPAWTEGSGWKSTAWTTSRTSVYLNKHGIIRHQTCGLGCLRGKDLLRFAAHRPAFSPRWEHQQTGPASCFSPTLREVGQKLLQVRR